MGQISCSEPVAELANRLMSDVLDHCACRPVHPSRVKEVVEALALATAAVLNGVPGADFDSMRGHFDSAVDIAIAEYSAHTATSH